MEEPFSYDLNTPDGRYPLPDYLEEISGVSFTDQGTLVCIQDEKAIIYELSLEKKEIINQYKFGKDADYEDLVTKGNTAYVLRNNGDIYRIKNYREKDRNVKKYETPLKEKNDTEGLAYDPLTSSLLIACKGSPSIQKDRPCEGYKAIYRFDLLEKELITRPLFLIDLEHLETYKDQSTFRKFSIGVAKKLRLVESESRFQPSGLAFHPTSGYLHLISSVGKLLVILDRQYNVKVVRELDPVLFRQPEGICFSPSGDLYISNEGKGGKGYILKFSLHGSRQ